MNTNTAILRFCLLLVIGGLCTGPFAAAAETAAPVPFHLTGENGTAQPFRYSGYAGETGTAGAPSGTGIPGYTFAWVVPSTPVIHPQYLSTDTAGNLYATDFWNNTISRYSPAGSLLAVFGSDGTGNGQFGRIGGIAINASGYIYAVDQGNNRTQVLGPDGRYIAQWGSYGTGDGEFSQPRGIALDSAGNVFIADTGNNRIEKFGTGGNYLAQWGTAGSGNGDFSTPVGIAANASDALYVTDQNNYRVQVFDPNGTFLNTWGSYGYSDGDFYKPIGIAADSSGNIYVVDGSRYNVQVFSADGVFQARFGSGGFGPGQFWYPYGIATDTAGRVYIADTNGYRIVITDSSGTPVATWGTGGNGNGQFIWPTGSAIGPDGHVYIVDYGNSRIEEFAPDGTFAGTFGSLGYGYGQFQYPYGMAINSSGYFYIADTSNNVIQVFDPQKNFLFQWGGSGTGSGYFSWPEGIACAGNGDVYVVDTNNNRVQVFDPSGNFITTWGTYGTSGASYFNEPYGIALDATGNVYVTDTSSHRVQKFDAGGNYLGQWGQQGSGTGDLWFPEGIAADAGGHVLVGDSWNGRVEVFDTNGNYLTQFASLGMGNGQFENIYGVSAGSDGSVYVVDVADDRIQKFVSSVTGEAPVADFSATPRTGTAPLTVLFTDLSKNSPDSWNWTFGDGSRVNATEQDPVHTYTAGGTYAVSLNATNSFGSDTGTKTAYIIVTAPPQGNDQSSAPSVSANGRYAAFESAATSLVPGDTNGKKDIFVRDRQAGTTTLVSKSSAGAAGNGDSANSTVSADGRYVVFESLASNLVTGDSNGMKDIFVRDRQTGTTTLVSKSSAGVIGNGNSYSPVISADGRYVAFESLASDLVTGDSNGMKDIFVRDRQSGTTTLVSKSSAGVTGNGDSASPSVSADGRYVSFDSGASNLVSGDTNGVKDIFVRDRQTGTTTLVSKSSTAVIGNGNSASPSVSADGRYVSFGSGASNLVSGDTNGVKDIFVRDRQTGTTTLVSKSSTAVIGNGDSASPSVSADGRYVSFGSGASNLVSGDTNGVKDIFVRDRQTGTTTLVSKSSAGVIGNGNSASPSVSADGRYVAFESAAGNLVTGDINGIKDIFVRDRQTGTTTLVSKP